MKKRVTLLITNINISHKHYSVGFMRGITVHVTVNLQNENAGDFRVLDA